MSLLDVSRKYRNPSKESLFIQKVKWDLEQNFLYQPLNAATIHRLSEYIDSRLEEYSAIHGNLAGVASPRVMRDDHVSSEMHDTYPGALTPRIPYRDGFTRQPPDRHDHRVFQDEGRAEDEEPSPEASVIGDGFHRTMPYQQSCKFPVHVTDMVVGTNGMIQESPNRSRDSMLRIPPQHSEARRPFIPDTQAEMNELDRTVAWVDPPVGDGAGGNMRIPNLRVGRTQMESLPRIPRISADYLYGSQGFANADGSNARITSERVNRLAPAAFTREIRDVIEMANDPHPGNLIGRISPEGEAPLRIGTTGPNGEHMRSKSMRSKLECDYFVHDPKNRISRPPRSTIPPENISYVTSYDIDHSTLTITARILTVQKDRDVDTEMWLGLSSNDPQNLKEAIKDTVKANLTILTSGKYSSIPYTNAEAQERTAMDTLREMLSEVEFRQYVKKGFILVRGKSGRIYQIFRNNSHTKIYEKGVIIEEVCMHIKDHKVPKTDSVIARKIMIEYNEDEFKAAGNIYRMQKAA